MVLKKHVCTLIIVLCGPAIVSAQVYKDPRAPVEARVKDLLKRMTLEEKVGQMSMSSLDGYKKSSVSYGVLSSPFSNVYDVARQSANAKRYAREETRLGIPPIQIGECLHGQLAAGATTFPQAIAQGSTWNPTLIQKMGAAIAYEASTSGVDQALSPLFDLIRDARYGRVEECFAEDPYLTGQLGSAFVRGMQGDPAQTRNAFAWDKVLCTGKHFAAYSKPLAGINLAPADIGERELRSMFLPPFREAVQEANIAAVMPSYNEIDGIPAHSNEFLLKQILRKEWGFKGYIFSDYGGLSQLYDFHKVAKTKEDAAVMGITAGVDLEAAGPDIYAKLVGLIKSGRVKEAQVDSAVARILTIKFKAGLFEKPLPDTARIRSRLHQPETVALSQQIAEESVILLKNDKNLLPLDVSKLKSIAVIGPNANKVQYGDYSFTRDNLSGVNVLEGIKQLVGAGVKVNYAQGCELSGLDKSGFDEAIKAAESSDAVVVVLGTTSVVWSGVGWNGQAPQNEPLDPFTCGEGYDVTDINPQGVQRDLLQAVYKTGKPVILVLVHGRPWSISWEKDNIPAILEAWYPGEKGGTAIANILFGKVNPSGRLNMSIPQSSGHIPVFYNYVNSAKGINRKPGTIEKPGLDYVYGTTDPLFSFGFGLSYTSFEYSNLKVSKDAFGNGDSVKVSVDVKNTGSMAGKEVVQLYLGNKVNSVSTPGLFLRGFSKVLLAPGEGKSVNFTISSDDVMIWNRKMKEVAEPGTFEVMIGKAADNIVLKKQLEFK
ncbi:beta-glucosidase [Mucilaginibacter sp. SG538B]|uniref:glycoside hydrolase family 3 N-terminal domain-containing protein n=1 Tax=Mucilaginibacter sp. SG538B TaxID=2587021 RepID=UPI00159DB8F7|nr:glycoside hydrolase family 3 N-terminal domain-containing protein [Mucilaginibacter sp. SG538B]NVM67295.1 beta-glucosidase [Mucilaginibacter sp. SG538B]